VLLSEEEPHLSDPVAIRPDPNSNSTPTPVPSIWAIGASITRTQYWAFAITGLLTPLLLWAALSRSGWVDPLFLPGPVAVAQRLLSWMLDDDLLGDAADLQEHLDDEVAPGSLRQDMPFCRLLNERSNDFCAD
jgi:hypothetical protein